MNNIRINLLHYLQKTNHIPATKAFAIAGRFMEKNPAKNDFLFREDIMANEYFFLEEGFMRIYAHDVSGHEVPAGFYIAHQVRVRSLFFL